MYCLTQCCLALSPDSYLPEQTFSHLTKGLGPQRSKTTIKRFSDSAIAKLNPTLQPAIEKIYQNMKETKWRPFSTSGGEKPPSDSAAEVSHACRHIYSVFMSVC